MGMDVYGNNPSTPEGEYFRRNVWGWRPLADLCLDLTPESCGPCRYWHSNDGDGLNTKQARKLANALNVMIANGAVAAYLASREDRLRKLPEEKCAQCHATGIRSDDLGQRDGLTTRVIEGRNHPRCGQVGWCNGCDGRGSIPHWDTHYHVDIDDVRDFASFLAASGGFKIC